ncbi:MAG TPA: ribonuclease HII [Methanosarcinales archaeon]|nr:ribonuclease HII [Methanosarcinales archaeon]
MKIAGVDEAGKGPVIGPMCVAGVMIEEDKLHLIEELGLKDSKKVAPKKRELLSERIKETADRWFVLDVSAHQIDELRTIMTMNEVMVICHARVLENIGPDHAFLDAADVNEERFGRNVEKRCQEPVRVTARHKADARYPIVAAASIIAKVHRDRAIAALREEFGDFGSGYPSDPKTVRFLREWFSEHRSFPDFVRHSWKTVRSVVAGTEQTTLSAYR